MFVSIMFFLRASSQMQRHPILETDLEPHGLTKLKRFFLFLIMEFLVCEFLCRDRLQIKDGAEWLEGTEAVDWRIELMMDLLK